MREMVYKFTYVCEEYQEPFREEFTCDEEFGTVEAIAPSICPASGLAEAT
jgi:hypothetical protein